MNFGGLKSINIHTHFGIQECSISCYYSQLIHMFPYHFQDTEIKVEELCGERSSHFRRDFKKVKRTLCLQLYKY
ncbi:hypothetical protein PanWU01x14_107250 [Parasponia andersonii]|uniref:Uncharacterized protein n=1 Tax=Parasponia andersonii TaxID=3476 RepID=A0A2P5D060_PARAD|nr:hypothetical protein PanWU01x14_107250 [Parasponia andersonii]